MKTHIVQQGECLSSIAHAYGFGTYRAIYDHSDNAEFRKKRPDPAVILPGDEIAIPDPKAKTVTLATGQKHRIVVRRPKVQLRVRLRDRDGSPLANLDYTLKFDGGEGKGRTASDGLVQQSVPASIREATIEFKAIDLTLRLRCGTVDPVDEVSGVQVRLNNLGFDAGPIDGALGSQTQGGIRRFQEAHRLDATGDLDDATRTKLAQEHGC